MITLPKEWKTYADSIRDRCRDLIEFRIWSGIDINQFDTWRNNFITNEEKYFASCVLDSLIYRSNIQTYSLINQLLYKDLNNLFRLIKLSSFPDFPKVMTNPWHDPMIRMVSVIADDDPVTKSSNEILRFMKRHFHISENWIINPWNIKDEIANGVGLFIFIDDFLGTGHQFEEVGYSTNLGDLIKANYFVYAPLVAHEEGITYLNGVYPKLHIVSSEKLLTGVHSFFNNYFPLEIDEAKEFYLDMLKKRGLIYSASDSFGYGNLEIVFSFEHASPDNSLQVLHERDNNWVPLFNR